LPAHLTISTILLINPGGTLANQGLGQELKDAMAEAKKKEKLAFGGLFSKVSVYDDKAGVVTPG
jgi:hypothetical protein